jgi:hypothetical protein
MAKVWKIEIVAPNGLKADIQIDELVIKLNCDPVLAIDTSVATAVEQGRMIERQNEKPPESK